jgi:cell division transport system ATP-binding protein
MEQAKKTWRGAAATRPRPARFSSVRHRRLGAGRRRQAPNPSIAMPCLDAGGGAVRSCASGATAAAVQRRARSLVRFENVGMRYGAGPEVLRDINLRLAPGSFHFLTGPSGAGKTSLLKLMYLAERPSRGLISLFDRDIATTPRRELPALRRKIGVVFQDFRLIDHLSTFDNVALPLRVAGHEEEQIREHVTELLRWVGLADKLNARPATLSGGQQQRVAIARAVIGRPSLLLADEPTGNVDDDMALRLLRLFEEMNKLGTTLVIATHNEALVTRLGHDRIHLENGELTVERNRERRLG